MVRYNENHVHFIITCNDCKATKMVPWPWNKFQKHTMRSLCKAFFIHDGVNIRPKGIVKFMVSHIKDGCTSFSLKLVGFKQEYLHPYRK